MKKLLTFLIALFFLLDPEAFAQKRKKRTRNAGTPAIVAPQGTEINWKGQPPHQEVTVGALFGLGLYDGNAGFALLANFAKKLMNQGFAPRINNQVFLEAALGPMITSGEDPFVWGLHLRWDFHLNINWAFYFTGGFGGAFQSSDVRFHPRFAAGIFASLTEQVSARLEVSHEWTALGVSFRF